MKELTIAEKAERYDKALDNARYYHNGMEGDVCCVLEECFPELKECANEDDIIKKELISNFKNLKRKAQIDRVSEIWLGLPYDVIIAWLEKQGNHPDVNINKMVMTYSQTKDGAFGLPVNCMIRAYRKGINDALNLLQGIEK